MNIVIQPGLDMNQTYGLYLNEFDTNFNEIASNYPQDKPFVYVGIKESVMCIALKNDKILTEDETGNLVPLIVPVLFNGAIKDVGDYWMLNTLNDFMGDNSEPIIFVEQKSNHK